MPYGTYIVRIFIPHLLKYYRYVNLYAKECGYIIHNYTTYLLRNQMVSMDLSQARPLQGSPGVPVVLHPRQSFPRKLSQRSLSSPPGVVQPGVWLSRISLLDRLHWRPQWSGDDAGSHVDAILLGLSIHGGDCEPKNRTRNYGTNKAIKENNRNKDL